MLLLAIGAEEANECNPNCNGVHITTFPTNMRKLLPPGYSTFLPNISEKLRGVSPRRAHVRALAAEALVSQARSMQQGAIRRMGRLPIVGDMVQVKIPDPDRSKLDAPCLTALVIEVCEC